MNFNYYGLSVGRIVTKSFLKLKKNLFVFSYI
jgi:hypothetical protein